MRGSALKYVSSEARLAVGRTQPRTGSFEVGTVHAEERSPDKYLGKVL